MENKVRNLLEDVADYYSAKLAKHGETPHGVDWNGEESQMLRFEQLTKVIQQPEGFSLLDLGCGYGALFDYLKSQHQGFSYTGYDVSSDMIRAAQARHANSHNAHFMVAAEPTEIADYAIASGIFNVKLDRGDAEWREYLESALAALNRTSRLGFSFNCLTSYSDADKIRGYLYYGDPCSLFDYCKRHFSRHVALLHDYGLYEFTIIVRKAG